MCLHAVSRVPAFCNTYCDRIAWRERKQTKQWSSCPWISCTAVWTQRILPMSSKGENYVPESHCTMTSQSLEGRYLYYYTDVTHLTSHSSVQNKQFQLRVQSRDYFSLELTDFKTYDDGREFSSSKGCKLLAFNARNQHLPDSVSRERAQQNQLLLFIWTTEKDSTTFSGLSPIWIITVLSTFHFWP